MHFKNAVLFISSQYAQYYMYVQIILLLKSSVSVEVVNQIALKNCKIIITQTTTLTFPCVCNNTFSNGGVIGKGQQLVKNKNSHLESLNRF